MTDQEEGRSLAQTRPAEGGPYGREPHCDFPPVLTLALEKKRLANARARCALAGFELIEMPDGDFLVTRWGMVRALADIAAVEAFIEQVAA